MSGLEATAPTGPLAAVTSRSGGVAVGAVGARDVDLLMGSVYCAWELATPDEAKLALRWARRLAGQSRRAFADVDETTYVLGGQYLQALISGRRRTPAA